MPSPVDDDPAKPPLESVRPQPGADASLRRRLTLREELLLALLPTVTILLVLVLLEEFSQQRLLFASLASSAFLIYLDPQHGTNTVRTLTLSHLSAAAIGAGAETLLGSGYFAAAAAMIAITVVMVALDAVHPPAVSTALSFAFRSEDQRTLALFLIAVLMVAVLVILQRAVVFVLARLTRHRTPAGER